MITWFDQPYKGTNKTSGFEVLIHGIFTRPMGSVVLICLDEDGVGHEVTLSEVAWDWRYKRGRGWFSVDDPEDDKPKD